MSEVNSRWIDDEASHRERPDGHDAEQSALYRAGKRKLESVAATATVLLPPEILKTVDDLIATLNKRYSDWLEDLFETQKAMESALKALVAFGRRRMGNRRS